MTVYKTPKLTARYNKDLSITLSCRGKKIFRTRGYGSLTQAESFITGWFDGGAEKVTWKFS
jgi:hypothetical protein